MPETTALSSLEFFPYIDDRGQLPNQYQGTVGVYAIFDESKELQYIGYSRDIYVSLKQHLVRQPEKCYWLKVQTIDRPNRTLLDSIRAEWITENGSVPVGNGVDEKKWSQAIDVKTQMTTDEHSSYASSIDEVTQMKVLKQAARRIEAEILNVLKSRGVQVEIRFNPKLKETGLLDLK